MKSILIMFSYLLLVANVSVCQAKDGNAALYDATAPADSAFIRVLNNTPETVDISLSSKEDKLAVASYELGDYLFLAEGQSKLDVGGVEQMLDLGKSQVITFVHDGKSLIPLKDEYFDSLKKAQVSFYNLTSRALALKTSNGKHAIVGALEPNDSGHRQINEVKMAFAVFDQTQLLAEYEKTFLKKGRSYSYVVLEQFGKLNTFVVANKVSSIE